jgi:hypothetical protein
MMTPSIMKVCTMRVSILPQHNDIMELNIYPLSKIRLGIMTLYIMTLSIIEVNTMAQSRITLRTMKLTIMTISLINTMKHTEI